jgi:hypothetical protein
VVAVAVVVVEGVEDVEEGVEIWWRVVVVVVAVVEGVEEVVEIWWGVEGAKMIA